MDPPAESNREPASELTSTEFSLQTTESFGDQTTGDFVEAKGAFTDCTSVDFSYMAAGEFTDKTSLTPKTKMARPKIVLWGDSLTQTGWEGWIAQLANRYQRRADVVNRGMSGYNTAWYCHLPEEETHDNVVLCTIWFGANDASLPDLNPHHYVSVQDYSTNLKTLVKKAQTSLKWMSQNNILLITPPPVCHEQRFAYQKVRYGDNATGKLERTLENSGIYANACQQVATELGLPCLNLWEQFQTDEKWERFLSDGLHFSKDGHDFVFACLEQAIQQHFADLVVTPCPHTGQSCNSGSTCQALTAFGPYHDQIDAQKPQSAMKKAFPNDSTEPTSPDSKKPKMDAPGKGKHEV
ncbi:Isoamyl acetate-hydrolyzing esterase 1 homolog [Seminavis robusta]|uniref:Isoamyl acetate-hydrolyzing esterase 1 homolog n=1 Tax=Seminavis robusta TaxID=568900 RepID=A0A9N8EER7_9STRA|nr:Isoamyl acetate-hydrolyzing esterase 1 homolog [Seminavis robusta]|eukprot:Sro831_g208310.1 Isoamyl acetate-hydrolyzing esterase 1 homolog (353) ;mRNA; r:11004-12062